MQNSTTKYIQNEKNIKLPWLNQQQSAVYLTYLHNVKFHCRDSLKNMKKEMYHILMSATQML